MNTNWLGPEVPLYLTVLNTIALDPLKLTHFLGARTMKKACGDVDISLVLCAKASSDILSLILRVSDLNNP